MNIESVLAVFETAALTGRERFINRLPCPVIVFVVDRAVEDSRFELAAGKAKGLGGRGSLCRDFDPFALLKSSASSAGSLCSAKAMPELTTSNMTSTNATSLIPFN
jgi:hypothetical protein